MVAYLEEGYTKDTVSRAMLIHRNWPNVKALAEHSSQGDLNIAARRAERSSTGLFDHLVFLNPRITQATPKPMR